MAELKVILDKEKGTVKLETDDLNPIEVVNICLLVSQEAMLKITPTEKSNIIKPSAQNMVDVNKLKEVN